MSHDAVRPHPERFLDEPPQADLAGPLQARLTGLHRDRVGQPECQLEDLLADDDPLAGGDRTAEAVQQRDLCD